MLFRIVEKGVVISDAGWILGEFVWLMIGSVGIGMFFGIGVTVAFRKNGLQEEPVKETSKNLLILCYV